MVGFYSIFLLKYVKYIQMDGGAFFNNNISILRRCMMIVASIVEKVFYNMRNAFNGFQERMVGSVETG